MEGNASVVEVFNFVILSVPQAFEQSENDV